MFQSRETCIFAVYGSVLTANSLRQGLRTDRLGFVTQHANFISTYIYPNKQIWDIAKKRIRHIFDGHQQEIYSLDFSRDGRLIVSGSGDKTTRIWDMYDKSCKVLTISDADSLNNDAGVTSVTISPDATLVAAGSLDSIVRIWDVASGTLLERLRGHRDSVYSVAFTPDGKGLVSGSLDKSLKYWDVSVLASEGARSKAENATRKSTPTLSRRSTSIDRPAISPCTMDFVGHKVKKKGYYRNDLVLIEYSTGLRSFCFRTI